MRPRVFPAEDVRPRTERDQPRYASMRPRVFPAEDSRTASGRTAGRRSFNEAAGIPRGRLIIFALWGLSVYLLQ